MPKRRRTRSRRPRTIEEREAPASPSPKARPVPSVVSPAEAGEHAEAAPRRASAPTATATKTTSRHITRDYGYVRGELTRIAITMSVIVAGLVAAAIVLR